MVLAWGQFGPSEMGLFLAPIVRANLENAGATLKFKGANTASQISALSQMTPLKIANSASMWGHFRSRGLFPLLADFPPYRQIMKIHHILYLSNIHLLGSRYCLCKYLLQCMILQLRILIMV